VSTLESLECRVLGWTFSLALLLAAAPVAAEPLCPPRASVPTQAEIQQAMLTARDRGALWRFEKDGRRGYLYGTIHVGKPEWAMPGRTTVSALMDAETIVMEADPLDPGFAAGVTAPAKPHEAPALPAPLVVRLRQQALRSCVPWGVLRTMPPMMIAATLTLIDAAWAGFFAEYASEMVLAGYAWSSGKGVATLESTAVQRAAIIGGPPGDQLASIEAVLGGLEQGTARTELVTVAEAWARGDLDDLGHALVALDATERGGVERTVVGRNAGMARRIAELHDGGRRMFVAAGILHMVGEGGLPKLLVGRGFTVERIEFDGRVGLDAAHGIKE
jgi:uncharacterized protein YbaP (TraB family)